MEITTSNIEEFVSLNTNKYDTGNANITNSQYNNSFSYKAMKGKIHEEIFPNFRVSYAQLNMERPVNISYATDREIIEMHFTLDGNSLTSVNQLKDEFQIPTHRHNIFYSNTIKGRMRIGQGNFSSFEILLSPAFITKYLPENIAFSEFIRAIKKEETAFLLQHDYPLKPDMLLLIESMIHCKFYGHMRTLFFESRVLELLLLQLNQIQKERIWQTTKAPSVSAEEKMYFAKELIIQNTSSPLSLQGLAKQIGTNECSLKKNFKAIFGKTVFQFVVEEKMRKAQKMLQEKSFSIGEIATMVGYKNPQHFSTAFKQQFGISPQKFRNRH